MKVLSLELVADGFSFIEGPRWQDGQVWVSHIWDDAVDRIAPDGTTTRVVDLPGPPISIGFTPEGTLLVNSLSAGRLWKFEGGTLTDVADLGAVSTYHWGDIVLDDAGRVYVANQGMAWPDDVPDDWASGVFLIEPGEDPRQVAGPFAYANGLGIPPGGEWLVVAESFGHRLWRLPIRDDATLGDKELIIQFDDSHNPDGLCCDASGAVWSANATGREVVRVTMDGTVTHRISTGDDLAIGCILGGDDGLDLYVTTAPTAARDEAREKRGAKLWRARADVPAGGRP